MKYLLAFIILLHMGGCTPVWQQRPDASTSINELKNQRILQLKKLENWKIQGRAIIAQGKEGWHARLLWQEFDDTYQIKLYGPFAQKTVILNGTKESAVLITSNNQQVVSTDAENLIHKVLDVHLPINSLRYWVRGIPAPNSIESIAYDNRGRPTRLLQQSWTIDYLDYANFKTLAMPTKMFIKNADTGQRLRLVIDQWKTTSSEQSKTWH